MISRLKNSVVSSCFKFLSTVMEKSPSTAKSRKCHAFIFDLYRKAFNLPQYQSYYVENPEIGAKNLSEKLARIENGGPFEWPDMINLNHTILSFIGDAKKIANIGAGTATFEWHACENGFEDRQFIASEFDMECLDWCRQNRRRDNIAYTSDPMDKLLAKHGQFDLAVSMDVIEHVKDYKSFLEDFSQLAPRAILTTPNKMRSLESMTSTSPKYHQHVREWTAGEFYWILRMFYSRVELYAMVNASQPGAVKIGLLSTLTPLIAVCDNT